MFLAKIEYSNDSLAPFISEETISFHYGKHHNGYANTLNNLIEGTEYQNLSLEEIIIKSRNNDIKIFNNAAQLFNHDFYWKCLKKGVTAPSHKLQDLIVSQFCSFDAFKREYASFAGTMFGSGWSWLVADGNNNGKLKFLNTSNAETPTIGTNDIPLCVIDLWEHAYYIDYRNNRADYVSKIIENCINWDFCELNLEKCCS